MLPFLKAKKVGGSGVIVSHRKPDEPTNSEQKDSEDEGLIECARDLLRAINEQDHKAMAGAFKAAFQICESMPHDESQEATYDSQNELAAKEME